MKRTPDRGVKQNLKPSAYKRRERLRAVTACLLHNEPTSCTRPARLSVSDAEPERKRVPQGAQSGGADAKLCDLPPARLKSA